LAQILAGESCGDDICVTYILQCRHIVVLRNVREVVFKDFGSGGVDLAKQDSFMSGFLETSLETTYSGKKPSNAQGAFPAARRSVFGRSFGSSWHAATS
jgi:hypothetical protein